MINFRFHIASLIAVFLALALGVVMGSTVIDRAIVEGLRDRIDEVERNRGRRSGPGTTQLQTERDQLNDYVEQSAPWAVDNQLTDASIAIVAERGLDEEAVKAQAELLRPGRRRRSRGSCGSRRRGTSGATARAPTPCAPRSAARPGRTARCARRRSRRSSRRLAQGSAPAAEPDVLDALAKAGFVTLEGVGDGDVSAATFPGASVRALRARRSRRARSRRGAPRSS